VGVTSCRNGCSTSSCRVRMSARLTSPSPPTPASTRSSRLPGCTRSRCPRSCRTPSSVDPRDASTTPVSSSVAARCTPQRTCSRAACGAMVGDFRVGVFADPNGAYTTSAAVVARVDAALRETTGSGLAGRTLTVFGTGPVGLCTAILAARQGARARLCQLIADDDRRAALRFLRTLRGRGDLDVGGNPRRQARGARGDRSAGLRSPCRHPRGRPRSARRGPGPACRGGYQRRPRQAASRA
jgi:hypothetical protein